MHNARKKQSGFTLVELIVVIVILGILAAVAIPKFSDTSAEARGAVQNATLGALKTAWTVAYAKKKSAPTLEEVAIEMADPKCGLATGPVDSTGVRVAVPSGATALACDGVTLKNGTGFATFGGVASPADPSEIKIVNGG